MAHPTGRHRRRRLTLTGQIWFLVAAALAVALTYVFVPSQPRRERVAIERAPRRTELPPTPRNRKQLDFPPEEWRGAPSPGRASDPDRIAGALVRPYLPSLPTQPPSSKVSEPGEFDELADLVRLYLHVVG